jgi:hypothetical protein
VDCDCEFDYEEPDGEPSWHFSRTCDLCGFLWGALHCEHDGIQNPCPECGWIAPGKRSPSSTLGIQLGGPDMWMAMEMFDASPDGAAERRRIEQLVGDLPAATLEIRGHWCGPDCDHD